MPDLHLSDFPYLGTETGTTNDTGTEVNVKISIKNECILLI